MQHRYGRTVPEDLLWSGCYREETPCIYTVRLVSTENNKVLANTHRDIIAGVVHQSLKWDFSGALRIDGNLFQTRGEFEVVGRHEIGIFDKRRVISWGSDGNGLLSSHGLRHSDS